jgi:NAD(P)-dependent dehydrogenase (short-subunit alcohol dehydrogenase family)
MPVGDLAGRFTSSAAVVPVPLIGPYAAAKRAADWVTRLAATELGPSGVRAVSIAPGLTATEAAEHGAALRVDGGRTTGEYHLLERMAPHLPATDPLAGLASWRT